MQWKMYFHRSALSFSRCGLVRQGQSIYCVVSGLVGRPERDHRVISVKSSSWRFFHCLVSVLTLAQCFLCVHVMSSRGVFAGMQLLCLVMVFKKRRSDRHIKTNCFIQLTLRINQISFSYIDSTFFRNLISDFKDLTQGRTAVRSSFCPLQRLLCIPILIMWLHTLNIVAWIGD